MRQRKWTVEEQNAWRSFYPSLFQSGRASFTGFPLSRQPVGVYDVPEEERLALFEELWERGAFHFGLGNYNDVVLDKRANRCVYEFWKKKVRERLTDPEKQKIMAPDEPPYYYGTKRNPLEHDYYEVLNQSNVSLHDLNANPLKSFHERGLLMSDGNLLEFDTIVLATGFDSYTGSLTQMGIKSKNGLDLKDEWKGGVHTYLGMTVAGFPNCGYLHFLFLSDVANMLTARNSFYVLHPASPDRFVKWNNNYRSTNRNNRRHDQKTGERRRRSHRANDRSRNPMAANYHGDGEIYSVSVH